MCLGHHYRTNLHLTDFGKGVCIESLHLRLTTRPSKDSSGPTLVKRRSPSKGGHELEVTLSDNKA